MFKENVEKLIKNEEIYLKTEGDLHKNYVSFLNTNFDIEGLLKQLNENFGTVVVIDKPFAEIEINNKNINIKVNCYPIEKILKEKGDVFILYIPFVCDSNGEFKYLYGAIWNIDNF